MVKRSIEPNIADLGNSWLKDYKLDYKLEQEPLNTEIDKALFQYFSKSGGKGVNRPDTKLLLQDKNLDFYPVLIEYKGSIDNLVRLDEDGQVENVTKKGVPHFTNISKYAVNGAIHYANALLHHTSYTDIIAIGMTGHIDEFGEIKHKIGVYYVSKSNFGVGQKVGEYSDLSFLSENHFDEFIEKVRLLDLTEEETEKLRVKRESEINASLTRLNNDIYENEKGLGEDQRVYLVAATIMATLGVPGKVSPLEKSELKSSSESGNRDGDILIRKIEAFLGEKDLPKDKIDLIIRTFQNTLLVDNINKVREGESQLKRVFSKIVDDLGIYYKIGLTTDFTGRLFNEMYTWMGFSQDKLNDVVLTPSYVGTLLAKLARVNKDSFVWDFATGSAGLLVAAMNEMLTDAKNTINSPDELVRKEIKIKSEQLLGLEELSNVYMLAILNMILMGDGSSNILHMNSLTEFTGKYGFGRTDVDFPATAFILNPPYSAKGNGMIFVEKALNMMEKGYAAIIIQDSAGNGKAKDINSRILKSHTLVASIKMPDDLFVGKSNVKTCIFVFKVKERHEAEHRVKFIDLSNDGYARAARGKSTMNLRDVDNAKEKYDEVVKLVKFGQSQLNYLTEKEYIEDTIDIPSDDLTNNAGKDWNFGQHIKVTSDVTLKSTDKIISNKLIFSLREFLFEEFDDTDITYEDQNVYQWKEFLVDDLFKIESTKSFNKSSLTPGSKYDYVTRTSENEGVLMKTGFIDQDSMNKSGTWSLGLLQMDFFYRSNDWYAGQFVRKISPKFVLTEANAIYFTALLNTLKPILLSWLVRDVDKTFLSQTFKLPVLENGEIDFDYIENYVHYLYTKRIEQIENFMKERIMSPSTIEV